MISDEITWLINAFHQPTSTYWAEERTLCSLDIEIDKPHMTPALTGPKFWGTDLSVKQFSHHRPGELELDSLNVGPDEIYMIPEKKKNNQSDSGGGAPANVWHPRA